MTEIVISAQPSPAKKNHGKLLESFKKHKGFATPRGLQGVKLFITIILIIGFLLYSLLNVGRIVKGHLTTFPLDLNTAFDHESTRWSSSDSAIAKMAYYFNEHTVPEDKIFVFRQSDLAYYTKNKIAISIDSTYSHLYKISDMAVFSAALRDYGIRYIARPPYGVAEINNSSFSTFLASPQHSRIVFDEGGYQIFEVLPTPPDLKTITVRNVDFSSPEEMNKWHVTRMPMSLAQNLRTKPPKVSTEMTPPSITLRRKKAAIVRKELIDVLQPWDVRVDDSPALVGKTDFEVTNGAYVFSSNIKAKGVVKLYLDLYSESTSERKVIERKLLWSGVVNNKHKTISGQTLIMFEPAYVEESESGRSLKDSSHITKTAKLFFSLGQGGYLTVHDLNFKRLEYSEPNQMTLYEHYFSSLVRAYQDGWKLGAVDYDKLTKVSEAFTKPISVFGMRKNGVLIAQQATSKPVEFTSPTFLLPSIYIEEGTVFKLGLKNEVINTILHTELQHSGHGSLSTRLVGKCITGDTFTVTMSPASLRHEPRNLEANIELPCLPVSARFIFTLKRDIYRIPPSFTFGNLSLSNLSFSVQTWQNGQKLTKVNYFKSSDIESINPQSTLPQLPISSDF